MDNRKWTVSGQGKRHGRDCFEYFSFEVEMSGNDAMYYRNNKAMLESLIQKHYPYYEKFLGYNIY